MVLVVVGGHEFVEDASQTNSWGRHRGCFHDSARCITLVTTEVIADIHFQLSTVVE